MELNVKNKKISIKILLTFMLSIMLIVTGFTYAFYFRGINKNILIEGEKDRINILVKSIASRSRLDTLKGNERALNEIIADVLKEKGVVFATITDKTGAALAEGRNADGKDINIPLKILNKAESSSDAFIFDYKGNDYIIASSPVHIDEGFISKLNLTSFKGQEGNKGHVKVAFTLAKIDKKLNRAFNMVIFAVIIITVISVVLSVMLIRIIFKPVDEMIESSEEIACGNLSMNVHENIIEEFSSLSDSIGKISLNLTKIIKEVFTTVVDLSHTTDSIKDTSKDLLDGARGQSSATNKVLLSITEINDSTKLVAQRLESLSTSADITSTSTETVAKSINTISENTGKLSESIDNSSSSIIQMTSSIKEIAKNTDELSKEMTNTKESITELDKSIHNVTKISKEAYDLSEKVKTYSSEAGLKSIEQMSASMDKIKESVEHSTHTIKKLGETSNQIGEILTVIEAVTEQTDLLALNAAILAAQAGRRGKGFAVVADEIKALADRNTTSTKEIAEIISEIQEDVENSIRAVSVGRDNVEEGVKQTDQVVKAFEYIYQSANQSLLKTNEIKDFSVAQADKVESIMQSIEMMVNTVLQVARATKEQKAASEHVMRMAEDISKIISNIKNAINEQSGQSRKLSVAVSDISSDIKDITLSVQEESNSVESVVAATNEVKDITSRNFDLESKIIGAVQKLKNLSQQLEKELNHFKLKND
jgi:methyl-accepting chemotaxis protein